MGTYLKFADPLMTRFNNAEYLSFLRRFRALLPFPEQGGDRPEIESLSVNESNGVPALGVSAAQLTVLDAVIDQLTDLNNQSRISQETETLNDTDKQRDNVAVYALNRINNSATLPLQAEQEAGKFLRNVVKPYTGIARLPLNQETETIKGLLVDLRKPENASAVQALSLTPYLNELERLNNLYESLVAQRAAERLASSVDNSKIVRAQGDDIYDDITSLAFAWSLANPSDEATAFIRNVNALISDAQTAYNQRMGQKKKKERDRPEIE